VTSKLNENVINVGFHFEVLPELRILHYFVLIFKCFEVGLAKPFVTLAAL
jgi:hypothetical protein